MLKHIHNSAIQFFPRGFFVNTSLITMTLIATTMTTPAQAQPSTKSINTLMSVTPVDNMLANDVLRQAYAQNAMVLHQVASQVIRKQNKRPTESQVKQIDKVINDYTKTLYQDLTNNTPSQLSQAYIKASQQTYTQAEVDAQIKFYGSDIGKSILKKQPQLLQNYMNSIAPKVKDKVNLSMKDIVPKLEADVKNVMSN